MCSLDVSYRIIYSLVSGLPPLAFLHVRGEDLEGAWLLRNSAFNLEIWVGSHSEILLESAFML